MIAIFAAMQSEVDICLACMSSVQHDTIDGYPAVRGDTATVCRTGMGREAERAMPRLLSHLSPSAVLSMGSAGGLDPDLRAGDVVLCHHIGVAEVADGSEQQAAVSADPRLLALAESVSMTCGLRSRRGRSVTVDSVAWGHEQKLPLRDNGYDIVEMESFWVGRAAIERSIPFLAVRVVTDQAGDPIPDVPGMANADGTIDYSKFLPFVQQHPEYIPAFSKLYEQSRRATESMRTFMSSFLPEVSRLFAAGPRADSAC